MMLNAYDDFSFGRYIRSIRLILLIFFMSVVYLSVIETFAESDYVFRQKFIEQDPDLSKPYIENEKISFKILMTICLLFHLPIYVCAWILSRERVLMTREKTFSFCFTLFVGYIITMIMTSNITDTIKIIVGHPRPHAFARGDYANYTSNITEYYNNTLLGRFGEISKYEDQTQVRDIFMSFPSGHTSLVFSATLYIYQIIKIMKLNYTFINLIFCGMFVVSCYVAQTRIQDYYHRPIDVTAGVIIGSSIGSFLGEYITNFVNYVLINGLDDIYNE